MSNQIKSPNFYTNIPEKTLNKYSIFFKKLNEISDNGNIPIYIINRPLTDRKYNYEIKN